MVYAVVKSLIWKYSILIGVKNKFIYNMQKVAKAKLSPFYALLVKQSLNIFGMKDEMIHTMIVCFLC